MCDTCDHLQKKISLYQDFLKQPFDPVTVEAIKETILELEQRKAMMHRVKAAAS
jgi:hypothetical protein